MKTLNKTWKRFLGIFVITIVFAFTTMEALPAANQGGPAAFIVECELSKVQKGQKGKSYSLSVIIWSPGNPSQGIAECHNLHNGKVVSVTPVFIKKVPVKPIKPPKKKK